MRTSRNRAGDQRRLISLEEQDEVPLRNRNRSGGLSQCGPTAQVISDRRLKAKAGPISVCVPLKMMNALTATKQDGPP